MKRRRQANTLLPASKRSVAGKHLARQEQHALRTRQASGSPEERGNELPGKHEDVNGESECG
jgi:hypothetical protein